MKYTKIFRVLKIITFLDSGYRQWSAGDLAKFFGVSKRTIFRDLSLMEEMDIPIYYDEKQRCYSILDSFNFSPPHLEKGEAIAIWLAASSFQQENFPYHRNLATGIAKIYDSLPTSVKKLLNKIRGRVTVEQELKVDLSQYRETIKQVEAAVAGSYLLGVKYYSASRNEISRRRIAPYNLFFREGVGYLAGYCHTREEVRLFRIDRIRELEMLDRTFERPEDFSLEEYMGSSWGVERGEELEIELIFTDRAAREIKEYDLHPSQEIEELGDDKIVYRVKTCSREEIKSWILSFGSMVEVVKPEVLRKDIEREIKEMKKIY